MADKKITQLPAAAGVSADDLFAIVDAPSGAATTKKATAAQVRNFIGSQIYTGAAPPVLPDDPTRPALFYPTGGGSLLQFDLVSQTWV